MISLNLPSPVQKIQDPFLKEKDIELWIKREDLIHPELGGNKWRKLKYNLETARQGGAEFLATFGGAYSNHIYAVASAGKRFNFRTIGFIRGEYTPPLNPTLSFAVECGMELHYLDRTTYREKDAPELRKRLSQAVPGSLFWIPEGGTNALALKGVEELAGEIQQQFREGLPDYVAVAAGTGGTAAGLIRGLTDPPARVLVFPALKGDFMENNIRKWLEGDTADWQMEPDYHFGGFGRFTDELIRFINEFYRRFTIPLEPLYTGKMFYGLFDMIHTGRISPGARILAIHTGGLQGITGFNQRFGKLIP